MLFLIAYDRTRGVVATKRVFADSERQTAEDARLALELDLNRRAIKASSEHALRQTHRRYFEDFAQLARSSASSTGDR